jgi:hypothetical protein
MNIQKLPPNAYIVEVQKEENTNKLYGAPQLDSDKGTIVYVSEEMKLYKDCKIVFNKSFSEDIKIDGKDYLYFRQIEGIYYTFA